MKCLPGFISIVFLICLAAACDDETTIPQSTCSANWEYAPTAYDLQIPESLPEMNIPTDNPMTTEGIALGRQLFYDPILSGDNTLACAGCHLQENGFTDADRFSEGIDGSLGNRNTMQIINLGYSDKLFWDGRAVGLENQALEPVENPIEMHETWVNAIIKLKGDADYPKLFYQAFGDCEITKELAAKAIAQFERTLISGNAKFDKAIVGGTGVFFTEEELNGYEIFFSEKGDCFHCHGGGLLTDNKFHNNGLDTNPQDFGLALVSNIIHDKAKFKTPTLRNIELTAPYMHDGRFQTLEEVIDFYSEGLQLSTTVDPLMINILTGGVQLTEQEKSDLIAFLKSLTDTEFIENPNFSSPF